MATDSSTVAQWRTDEEMCELVGDWWTDEMELHNDATMEQNVESANEMLKLGGFTRDTMRVLRCRESESGDGLEWLAYEV